MPDKNEMVVIEIATEGRLRLYGQITARMEKSGFNPCDWKQLHLGFELPAGWPIDMNAQPTLAQLTVLARKLKMRIVIGDINLVPASQEGTDDTGSGS